MKNIWAFAAALVVGFSFGACTCNGNGNGEDAGVDGGDDERNCSQLGESCAERPCCLGGCNADDICTQGTVTACGATGEACKNGTDCCTRNCQGGVCSGTQCIDVGAACSGNSDCCTANCSGGTCAIIPGGGCKVLGQACGAPGECCSTNCKGGKCEPAYPCAAGGDLCFGPLDCCSNQCSKTDGSAGYCITPSGGCTQDGLPCANSSNCCTRICMDPGTGATVCLPATGCRMTGSSCTDRQACCGGGTNPNGTVACVKSTATDAYGRCDNGQACNPVGNICGATFLKPDGTTFSVNASQNCCNGKKEVCQLDSSGIPRCAGCPPDKLVNGVCQCPNGYDGTPGCCIDEGVLCQYKDQCCGGMACVPDSAGILRCSGGGCIPLGTACTQGSGDACCQGECLQTGEFGFTCRIPPTGGCKLDTEACQDPDDCCSKTCTNGVCTSCKPNGQSCTSPGQCCSNLCHNGLCVPGICQPIGATCSATADCCTGTSCQVAAGSTSGTCQKGTECAQSGQSCNGQSDCCTNLNCLKTGTNAFCDGTTACSCNVIIG